MTDSVQPRLDAAARQIRSFLSGHDRKVIVDIEGMTHGHTCGLLYGGPWKRLGVGWRYLASLALYINPFPGFKVFVYRRMGMKIGRNVYISPGVYLDIVHPELLELGDNVIIGMGASIATHERSMHTMTLGRVTIGNNVVVGGLSLIRAGVRIGDGAEIDAMMNITRSVKAGARVVASRNGQLPPTLP